MNLYIENMQNIISVDEKINKLIESTVLLTIQKQKIDLEFEISILLVDDQEIRNINKEHRKIDNSTDVLSFPMLDIKDGIINNIEGDLDPEVGCVMLGDIVVSLEKAKYQANEYGHTFERELAFLITHGMLHLFGYDHEIEDDSVKMFGIQEEILKVMNLERG